MSAAPKCAPLESPSVRHELLPTPQWAKGWGSFHSPSVEALIRAEPGEYTPPPLPDFVQWLDVTPDVQAAAGAVDPEAFRRFFFLDLRQWTFLNHGAFGAALRPLVRIRQEWTVEQEMQPLRFIDRQLLPLIVHTIREMADWLRVPPTTLTLHNNVTTALNILLSSSIPLPPGSRVLRLNITYGSVKKMLDLRPGIVQVELPVPLPLASPEQLVQLVDSALASGPFALAVFDHVSSNSGIKLPVASLVAACHKRGVRVLVDGAHALGSVTELGLVDSGVDYYVSNFHKWLCHPKGAAMMYVRADHAQEVRPLVVSHGTGAGYTSDFVWTGCQDYGTWLTLLSTKAFWSAVGLGRCVEYAHALVLRAARQLAKRWRTDLLVGGGDECAEEALTANMVCVRLPGSSSPDYRPNDDEHNHIQNLLHFLFRIEVPIKVLGTPHTKLWVRLSAHVYNAMEQYERLGDAIELIIDAETGHARTWEQVQQRVDERKRIAETNGLVSEQIAQGSGSFFKQPEALVLRPDHKQVCIPLGAEERAREFYIGVMGLIEVPRPKELEQRGGFWLYCGPKPASEEMRKRLHANVHIGSEDLTKEYYSRSKAHIAYVVQNIHAWRSKLAAAGYPPIPSTTLPGMDRFDIRDPFGNRVELIEYAPDSQLPGALLGAPGRPPSQAVQRTYFWRSERAYKKEPLLRVAVYQAAAAPADVGKNLQTIHAQLSKAKAEGADLVLFSELFLTGYALSREDTHRLAMQQESQPIRQLRDWCRELGVAACVGYPELVLQHENISPTQSDCSCCNPSEKRCVYNAAVLIDDKGEILLSYRKTHLWELVEKSFFTPGSGDELKVVEYKGVRMGINICYDIEFAENSRVLTLDGAQLVLVPTALAKGELHETVPLKVVPTRAVDNHVWIAYANHVGPSYKDKNFCGLSAIVGPDGVDLARANEHSTTLLVHDLVPGDYATKFETTPLLIDRRAQLYETLAHQFEWTTE